MKHRFFNICGLRAEPPKLVPTGDQDAAFKKWCHGKTGNNFVDANMRELLQTGWMSNRGRQNVASFLAKELLVDWTRGAHWFQQNLIDSDIESNWGNWAYLAGVSVDPKNRKFDTKKQALIYDPKALYQKKFLEVPQSTSIY